jgi:hypothetical protein
MSGFVLSVIRGLGQWNANYRKLNKRYGGKQPSGGVMFGFFLSTPTLMFDYGRTFCVLKSRRRWFSTRSKCTQLKLIWPDVRFRLDLNSPPLANHSRGMKPVPLGAAEGKVFSVRSNQPEIASKMLSDTALWQLEQLKALGTGLELKVTIQRGEMLLTKSGYLKDYNVLDDLLRLGLELFDQFMLVYSEGIDFVAPEQAMICTDIKCPICSELISQEMVVCPRCKTPHCLDCWEYNGQCATYACHETRFQRVPKSEFKTS